MRLGPRNWGLGINRYGIILVYSSRILARGLKIGSSAILHREFITLHIEGMVGRITFIGIQTRLNPIRVDELNGRIRSLKGEDLDILVK